MTLQHPAQIPTGYPGFTPYTLSALAPPSLPSGYGSSILTDCRSESSLAVDNYPHRRISKDTCSLCRRQLITFDMIPDDVLLEIFDLYVDEDSDIDDRMKQSIEKWITLAHVCQRWRIVVFQSPLRLNLQLVCTPQTPTRDSDILDIWSPLPLIIRDFDFDSYDPVEPFIADNIIAALEHNDRVCQIQLIYPEFGYLTNSAAILKPFPELTILELGNVDLYTYEEPGSILPDAFLGGSAPRLRSLELHDVSFPALPKLLLSVTHLVNLTLDDIPRSGYILPEAMATSLSALTSLDSLCLCFDYPPPRPALETRRLPPPLTPSILPNLTKIKFKGSSEYLEVILARITAPRLDKLHITFFNQIIFNTPQLFHFISQRPTLRAQEKGHITFKSWAITVKFSSPSSGDDVINVGIRCTPSEWQLSSMEQVCSSLPPVFTLDDLYISEREKLRWQDNVENTLWLDLLRSFVAVKNLYISEAFVPRIAPALKELVGGRTTEVLPVLENLFLGGFLPSRPLQKGIEKFVAARRLTSRPVAVSRWD